MSYCVAFGYQKMVRDKLFYSLYLRALIFCFPRFPSLLNHSALCSSADHSPPNVGNPLHPGVRVDQYKP